MFLFATCTKLQASMLLRQQQHGHSCLPPFKCTRPAQIFVISPYLACFNEMTVAALCAPRNFYFLISSCVIAALAVPRLGDIIKVITTSSSSCRQIILLGSFFSSPFSEAPHRRGNYIFHQASLLSVL